MFDTLASPLAGSLVSLEPLEERHVENLRAAASDPRVSQWLPVPLHEARWFEWWLEDGIAALAERRELTFATVRRVDGVAVGSTRFLELRERDRSVEIGWTWLAPAAWGTGVNVEAKLLMLAHAGRIAAAQSRLAGRSPGLSSTACPSASRSPRSPRSPGRCRTRSTARSRAAPRSWRAVATASS